MAKLGNFTQLGYVVCQSLTSAINNMMYIPYRLNNMTSCHDQNLFIHDLNEICGAVYQQSYMYKQIHGQHEQSTDYKK